jgi:hypothetical protein
MHPRSRRPDAWALACSATLLLAACSSSSGDTGTPDADGDPNTARLTGTAYTFNQCAAEPEQTQCRIVGATIHLVEFPDLSTTTDDAGAYALDVPAGSTVTPYIVADGYRTIYLQTYTVDGDLENVNFQTPDLQTYAQLYLLLTTMGHVAPDLLGCVIVTTASVPEVVGMPFDQFRTYNPHGVPGTTAHGDPALPNPIYFNENVVPDASVPHTSEDGGILWTNVPPGVYTVSASHPQQTFADFVADCRLGRIINANPPWGLHGLHP